MVLRSSGGGCVVVSSSSKSRVITEFREWQSGRQSLKNILQLLSSLLLKISN